MDFLDQIADEVFNENANTCAGCGTHGGGVTFWPTANCFLCGPCIERRFPNVEAEFGDNVVELVKSDLNIGVIDLSTLDLIEEVKPTILPRQDGPGLLYDGQFHMLCGESGTGKSWVALEACRDKRALYIDFETRPVDMAGRIKALDMSVDDIAYAKITGRFGKSEQDYITSYAEHADIVVLDGVTVALSIEGISINDNDGLARWIDTVPRFFQGLNTTVLMIDHVTKSTDNRTRGAIGAQHKLAAVDVSYYMDVQETWSRTKEGHVQIRVDKDRNGYYAIGDNAADVYFRPDNGRLSIDVELPTLPKVFQPTFYMERVSETLEVEPDGMTKPDIRSAVTGKNQYIDNALIELLQEEYVKVETRGHKKLYFFIRPYREPVE